MKKLLFVLLLTITSNVFAQSSYKEDVALVQSIYGKSKTDLVNQALALSAAEKAAFQPIYDNYETERKEIGRKKIDVINKYIENYSTLTAEQADVLTKENMKSNLDMEKLYAKTYDKAKKAIGAINAAEFIQFEIFFQTAVRTELQSSIPFIGEIESLRKK